ncbi:MAG: hypothetical protein K1X86_10300 [Ignavibacteria bacterium]|nr:hypothetical protein [Ignavibacteria bacterium]
MGQQKIILLFLIFFFTGGLFAQSGWVIINTGTTNNLNDVSFENSLTGFVVGDNNTYLKSTNGGFNWSNMQNINPYNGICCW